MYKIVSHTLLHEVMNMDRSEINRALSKAIAYKNVGKDAAARQWARELIKLLECADILAPASETDTLYKELTA